MCQSTTTGATWWSGRSQYRPKGFDGNSATRKWTPFSCQSKNQSYIGGDTDVSVSNKKTATKTGAFSFGGDGLKGNLKASQTWTGAQTVTFKKAPNTGDGYSLCGNTGKYFNAVSGVRQI
jgi:hypothetical protein